MAIGELKASLLNAAIAIDSQHVREHTEKTTKRSSSSSVNKNKCKEVKFNPKMTVRLIQHHVEMSDSEVEACWSTEEDNVRIQSDILNTTRYIRWRDKVQKAKALGHRPPPPLPGMPGDDAADALCCSRGLEHMKSSEHLRRRESHKSSVINAVLREQTRQRRDGNAGRVDPDKISEVSLALSKPARDLAFSAASADAAAARLLQQRAAFGGNTGVRALHGYRSALSRLSHAPAEPADSSSADKAAAATTTTGEKEKAAANVRERLVRVLSLSSLASELSNSNPNDDNNNGSRSSLMSSSGAPTHSK